MSDRLIKNSYNSGELSPLIDGRTDLSKYYNGCSKIANGLPLSYGGIIKRSGTEFIAQAKTKCKLFEFEFSANDTMIIEMGNLYARFYQDGARILEDAVTVTGITIADPGVFTSAGHTLVDGDWVVVTAADMPEIDGKTFVVDDSAAPTFTLDTIQGDDVEITSTFSSATVERVYEIVTPYSSTEVFDIHFTQSADVLYMAHTDIHPQKMSRFAVDNWTIADIDFTGGPFLTENIDDSKTLTFTHDEVAFEAPWYHLAGAEGILTSTGHTPFLAEHVGSLWEITKTRTGDVTISQITAGTSVSIRVKGDFSLSTTGFAGSDSVTIQRKEGLGEFQDYRTFTAASSFSATELFDDVFYRLVTVGTLDSAMFTAKEQIQHGVVHVDSFNSTSSVNVTVVNDVYHDNSDPVSIAGLTDGGTAAAAGDVNVRTAAVHGLSTGDAVFLEGITDAQYDVLNTDGTNDTTFVITVLDVNNFTLDGTDGTVPRVAGVEVTVGVGSFVLLSPTTTTAMWAEGSWSSAKGYPVSVTFFESRLWWAGTDNQPQTLWGSRTNDFENYTRGTLADDSVIITIQDNNLSAIEWIAARRSLVAGTANKEYAIRANNIDDPITPADIKASPQSTHGSDHLQPQTLNDGLFYIQRSGRKMWIMKFSFADEEFRSTDGTLLSEHLLESAPTDIATQGVPESVIWLTSTDGVLLSFTYNSDEEVAAWARHLTGTMTSDLLNGKSSPDALYESVAVIAGDVEDDVYVSVQRIVNSNTVRYIEKFSTRVFDQLDEANMLDSAVTNLSGEVSGILILASDTVRFGSGLFGSSLFGGST